MDNADIEKVVSDLQSAVQRVSDLPSDILTDPKFLRANSKEIPIIELALVGPQGGRLRDQFADQLKNVLEDIQGISQVRLVGFLEREFQVLLDPEKLERNHVGIEEVFSAVKRRTQNIPAGYIRSDSDQRLVRVQGQVQEASELENIVVRSNFSGNAVRVKDVARVSDGSEEPQVLARYDGKPATLLVVTKKADADAVSNANEVLTRLEKFKETLPSELSVFVYNNEAKRVEERLEIVISNALGGLALVLIVLLIFLPGILGIMTALSLPLSVLGTLALMPQLGANFNTITMLALVIAIGMLVDNSVVISENYARLRSLGLSVKEAAHQGVSQFWLPIFATALTTVAAFLPMLVTKGVMGDFIKWIPIVVTIALTMSLFESFFLLPGRLIFTMRKPSHVLDPNDPSQSPWFENVKTRFSSVMNLFIRRRYIMSLGIVGLLAGSLVLSAVGNRFELFPPEGIEFYFAKIEMPSGTPIEKTDAVAAKLAGLVKGVLGDSLQSVVQRTGVQSQGPGDPNEKNGDEVAMLTLVIDAEKARTMNTQETLKKLRAIEFSEAQSLSFDPAEGGPPVGKPLTITLRSSDEKSLQSLVAELKEELSKVNGALDITDDVIKGGPEYALAIDHKKLAQLGLSVESVGFALRTALQGSVASELSDGSRDVKLVVKFDDAAKATLSNLENTKVMTPNGELIALKKIASVSSDFGPSVKKRFQYIRSITVSGNVIPEVLTSGEINKMAQELVDQKILEKYPSVTYRVGGEEESTKESVDSLFQAMMIAFLGIFTILVFLFRGFIVPFLVLTSIPLGLVGVLWAFFLHGRPLSFIALIGVVGLAGVVVNSAIVLMSYIEELIVEFKKKNGELKKEDLLSILSQASSDRLRAVLVTSLTTIGGLMPTAYSIGGSDPILVPMTLALAWGLISGTLLTILWIPISYAVVSDFIDLTPK